MTAAAKREPRPEVDPTEEQLHILSLLHSTRSNLLINALAGTGKTSTLELIQNAAPAPVLCLAFNRRIADEMEKRFRSTTTVRTLNGLGHRIWAAACAGRLSLNPKKSQDILRELISGLPKPSQGEAYDDFWSIISGVALAKSLGYIPEGKFPNAKRLIRATEFFAQLDEVPSSLCVSLIDQTLIASITSAYAGNIDYNDQVYMPALFGGTYPRFPLVLIDEAQDLSPVNHEMLGHLKASRLIAVGDARQSVYAFRGAVSQGMSKLRERFSMTEADLTTSFRCPSNIVKAAHWHAPAMRWSREGGRVAKLRNPSMASFIDGSAIICRNNAPLFSLALRLLSAGRSVSVSGSDVGPRIIAVMKKLGPEAMPQEELLNEIEIWRQEKLSKQSTSANDLASCMQVFANQGSTLGQAIAYADHLFKQKGTITLLSGHKAKGLEWSTVYHLDSWLCRENEQDLNLRYVITTRAMQNYYEIDSREVR